MPGLGEQREKEGAHWRVRGETESSSRGKTRSVDRPRKKTRRRALLEDAGASDALIGRPLAPLTAPRFSAQPPRSTTTKFQVQGVPFNPSTRRGTTSSELQRDYDSFKINFVLNSAFAQREISHWVRQLTV